MEIKKEKELKTQFIEQLLEFLQAIHGNNTFEIRFIADPFGSSSILCHDGYIYLDLMKGKKSKYCEMTVDNLIREIDSEYLVLQGPNVYFTVNTPNFNEMQTCCASDEHIIKGGNINAQFVDIDAPKEIRKDTLKLKTWKKNALKEIADFPLIPSIVVESGYGYHAYWLLQNGEVRLYKHIQMQLVQHFNGDLQCVNESRVLRLPFFQHRKDPKNPLNVLPIYFSSEQRYTQEELKMALPELEEKTLQRVMEEKKKDGEIPIFSETRKERIYELLLNELEYVKASENKITTHCCLPDHPDLHPSAWIDTNYMWYHCSGCGTSLSVYELAEERGWGDILEAFDRYDINIDAKLAEIRENLVNAEDLQHLTLNNFEDEKVNEIAIKVNEKLKSFGQEINERHKQYIHSVIQILYKAKSDKPYLIPLEMGGGKTTIIKTFIQEMLKEPMEFGAIVSVERIEDVKGFAEEINNSLGKKVAYPLYGFKEDECLLNVNEGNEFHYCLAIKGKKCPYKKTCRYLKRDVEQKKYPVVIMTSEKLLYDSDLLYQKYGYFKQDKSTDKKVQREFLIIDEKPKKNFINDISFNYFQTSTQKILSDLQKNDISREIIAEFESAVRMVKPLFNSTETMGRSIFNPLDKEFTFTDKFWSKFRRIYNYLQEIAEIPKIIESIIKNGGFMEVRKSGEIKLITSFHYQYKGVNKFKTIIFDGTADIDLDYQLDDNYLFNFESLRTYDDLTIYQCNFISGSKSSMKDEEKLIAFCKDVMVIADNNPIEKIYLPVFKDNEDFIKDYLKKYIEVGRIEVAHYGSTRGSNKFKDCSIVILGGILHKSEDYYIGKFLTFYEWDNIENVDITCSNYEKVRRFNDSEIEVVKILDMLVDYTQELKRSKLRDNTKKVNGKVYIFHNDKILMDIIGLKFPKCNIDVWNPTNVIEMNVYKNNRNTAVQAICDYINSNIHKDEIYFDEILEAVGIKKQQFSNIMNNNVQIKAFIQSKGYVVRADEKDKRKKKLVKATKS